VLQDRVTQVSALAESSRAALAVVYQVMFPLNDQPEGLSALLSRFEDGEAIYTVLCANIFDAERSWLSLSCVSAIRRSTWGS
jgi:hypothetical protein